MFNNLKKKAQEVADAVSNKASEAELTADAKKKAVALTGVASVKAEEYGKVAMEVAVEVGGEIADKSTTALDGAASALKGNKPINGGNKVVRATREKLQALLDSENGELTLDDTDTDDGYDSVTIKIVLAAQ